MTCDLTLLLRNRYRPDSTPHVIGLYRNGNGIIYEVSCDHAGYDPEAEEVRHDLSAMYRITAIEERNGSMRWRNDLSGTYFSVDEVREAARRLDHARPVYDLEDLRYRFLDVYRMPYRGRCALAYMRVDRHRILALAAHRDEQRYEVTLVNTTTRDVERSEEFTSYDDAVDYGLRLFDTFTGPKQKAKP